MVPRRDMMKQDMMVFQVGRGECNLLKKLSSYEF